MPALSPHEALIADVFSHMEHVRRWFHQSFFPADEPGADSSSSISASSSSFFDSSTDSTTSAEDHLRTYLASMDRIRQFLSVIWNTQVLFLNNTVPKVGQLDLVLNFYKLEHTAHFRRNLRVAPDTFDALLGHFGNAASVESIAQWAGCSAGTVVACMQRVFGAVTSLHDTVIRKPTMGEKEAARNWVEEQSCLAWCGGYCMVDGMLVPLSDKPGMHGEAYFDRYKHANLHIIDYVLGPTGSMHDATAFELSDMAKDPTAWFTDHEWVWADSAYALQPWCIVPYKKPHSLIQNNKTFNYYLSKIWIKSEHTMGMLKGRFSSLRGLRQQITSVCDHLLALKWVEICLVLHNAILDIEQGCEDEDAFTACMLREGMTVNGDDGHNPDAEENVPAPHRVSPGERQRCRLKGELFYALHIE
ncbi:hypothetical protein BS47DRAFT_1402561 [Hydnum rufescens UP504]|uniref:DDE Tnp4 domain-containing protein n=1 Tax=Hydnum rufescens UP504 TaxID=1448309 RepID=A0A9P6DEY5_9AGAM|nr:hypothetical protein BS47DRAFT_1402561 [Hydnum rufescens UP504]